MTSTVIIYFVIVCLASVLSTFLSVYGLLRFRHAPGGRFYIIVTALSALFTFAYALEIYSVTYEAMRFWLRIEYLALPLLPVFILLMAVEYCGYKVRMWMCGFLLIIPVITIVMQNTNELHYLYYTSMGVLVNNPFSVVYLQYGPFYLLHTVFFYSCVFTSIMLLLNQLRTLVKPFRKQTYLMIVGLFVPSIGGLLNAADIGPAGIDLVPIFMSLSFVFHALALTSLRMFDVAPIARDIVFESIEQGVLVLNANDIIIDYNTSFTRLCLNIPDSIIGDSITDVLQKHDNLIVAVKKGKECDVSLQIKEQLTYFHVHFSPIYSKNNRHAGTVITFLNITERVAMEETLKHLARTDGLTEMYNRTYFMEEAEHNLGPPLSSSGQASLILFDIDYFKQVNDTYGHDTGDQVLTTIARITKKHLRTTDIAGRYGGEEFILCLPGTSNREAVDIANRLRLAIAEHKIISEAAPIQVTSSFGIAHMLLDSHSDPAAELREGIKKADLALYDAKREGRNCVRIYQTSLPQPAGADNYT